VRAIVKHVARRIRRYRLKVRICRRGDSHYARPEAMDWCEQNGVDDVLGLVGDEVLRARMRAVADDLCVRRAEGGSAQRRTWSTFPYAPKSWTEERRVAARREASPLGLDVRYVTTPAGMEVCRQPYAS